MIRHLEELEIHDLDQKKKSKYTKNRRLSRDFQNISPIINTKNCAYLMAPKLNYRYCRRRTTALRIVKGCEQDFQ